MKESNGTSVLYDNQSTPIIFVKSNRHQPELTDRWLIKRVNDRVSCKYITTQWWGKVDKFRFKELAFEFYSIRVEVSKVFDLL